MATVNLEIDKINSSEMKYITEQKFRLPTEKKKLVWVACFESYPKDKNTYLLNNQIHIILNVNAWHRFWFSVFFGAKWKRQQITVYE